MSDWLARLWKQPLLYRLDGHTPVSVADTLEWAIWREAHQGEEIVARTRIAGAVVSTVFLGIDHGFSLDGSHTPVVFETMIFREDHGGFYGERRRYCTWDDAIAGHKEIVKKLKAARDGWKRQIRAKTETDS
jgi:hypothetical protein